MQRITNLGQAVATAAEIFEIMRALGGLFVALGSSSLVSFDIAAGTAF
jgi:hypothetical protein